MRDPKKVLTELTVCIKGLEKKLKISKKKIEMRDTVISLLREENNLLREKLGIPRKMTVPRYVFKIFHSGTDIRKLAIEDILPISTGLGILARSLRTRVLNSCWDNGLKTVEDLCNHSRKDIAKLHNLGTKALKMLEVSMKHYGLELFAPRKINYWGDEESAEE